MDNYLSHRWPKGPGVQPPPMPTARRPMPRRPRRRRPWARPVAVVLCVALVLGLLFSASFWSVSSLSRYLDGLEPPDRHDGLPDLPGLPSFAISRPSDWTPEQLPWGEPDPAVQLALDAPRALAPAPADLYEALLPSIVYIEVDTAEGRASGTGFAVTPTGYLLTNYHVIDESTAIRVKPLAGHSAGKTFDAKVIGFDEDFDIAVLHVPAALPAAPLGDSDALRVGDRVYAIGNPMGNLQGTMTDGIVSFLDRDEEVNGKGMVYIQVSVPINPGNSGGVLVNDRGQVVGVTSAKITGLVLDEDGYGVEDSAVIENLGLALPTSDILPFVNRILATGKSFRPAIGVTVTRKAGQPGLTVAEIEKGVPARKAGLKEGDLILTANGQPVEDFVDLRRVLYRAGVDSEVTLTVRRDGKELDFTFALYDKLDTDEK